VSLVTGIPALESIPAHPAATTAAKPRAAKVDHFAIVGSEGIVAPPLRLAGQLMGMTVLVTNSARDNLASALEEVNL